MDQDKVPNMDRHRFSSQQSDSYLDLMSLGVECGGDGELAPPLYIYSFYVWFFLD